MGPRDINFSDATGEELARELAFRGMTAQRELEDRGDDTPLDTLRLVEEAAKRAQHLGLESELPLDSLINLVLDTPFNGAIMATLAGNDTGSPTADVEMWAHLFNHGLLVDILLLATIRMEHLKEQTGLSEQEEATLSELAKAWENEEEG